MEFQSDFGRIKSLLNTEEMTNIEFSEKYPEDTMLSESEKTFSDDKSRYNKQYGGKYDNINYLNDYTSAQYDSKKLDDYEKDFFDIFNKAREYRERVIKLQNKMSGGQEPDNIAPAKKKRTVNETLKLMLDMVKEMKKSNKYPGIQQKNFMKIAKAILDDVKKKEDVTKLTDNVKKIALQIAKNPDEYIKRFHPENVQGSIEMQKLANIRNIKYKRNNEHYPRKNLRLY